MRRTLLLASLVALVAGLGVSAFALAGDRDDRDRTSAQRSGDRDRSDRFHGGRAHRRGAHRGLHARLLGDLAERLGVERRELRAAIRGVKRRTLDRAVERGTITAEQRDTLAACLQNRRARRAAGCDRSDRTALRAAMRALRREAQPSTFAQRKRELAEDLATELGKSPDEVITAVRAELAEKLDFAVGIGAVTAEGRRLALACFDEPATCDVAALRREVRWRGHGRRRGGR